MEATNNPGAGRVRTALVANGSMFATTVLRTLIEASSIDLKLLILSRESNITHGAGSGNPPIPPVRVTGSGTMVDLARDNCIGVAAYNGGSALTTASFEEPFDFILVACCAEWIAPEIAALAKHACLNLHPSLLSRYRGPEPIFWQLKAGETNTGISLHHIEVRMDSGPVVAMHRVAYPSGASADELDQLLARAGASLFIQAIARWRDSNFELPVVQQDESMASQQSYADDQDFLVPVTWSAQRAFNFIRGVRGGPFTITNGTHRLLVDRAMRLESDGEPGCPYYMDGNQAVIGFKDGTLHLRCCK
ncbi:MAG: hypothetical protein DHS20C01_18550 [marine bacterium B5-7]|nr:MAG: hypothetical protein DHS20C01_18550 [marine bacterium B5-7]